MEKQQKDEIKAVASATECTGMLPAVPPDGNTASVRKMLRVHAQPRRILHRKKR